MISNHKSRKFLEGAFTLLELLVVMTLIILMAGLGVAAFKQGSGSDGTRGASYEAATLFDAARNEAIMRRVPVRVIFDVGTSATPDTSYRRMTVAYTTNNGTTWNQSGPWIKLPANAYYDYGNSSSYPSRPFDPNMTATLVAFGSSPPSAVVAYEYLPNGKANYSGVTTQPLKVVFSPGTLSSGIFSERPDKKSLYGFVVNQLGHTQQFADLQSLIQCP
jgi:type II secretory pathway pseudopilin PulG